ncbi:hypothetical protein PQR66_26980 [Paraburkholderia agricolaris]|uniref:Uncharacterized protein n=1 Tax=Paraburkholderia agricolaris TaxID=2152888 RepID=A0ABW8ZVM5_9BURK
MSDDVVGDGKEEDVIHRVDLVEATYRDTKFNLLVDLCGTCRVVFERVAGFDDDCG